MTAGEGAYLETRVTLSAHLQTGAAAGGLIGAREGGLAGALIMRRGCVRRFEGYLRRVVVASAVGGFCLLAYRADKRFKYEAL